MLFKFVIYHFAVQGGVRALPILEPIKTHDIDLRSELSPISCDNIHDCRTIWNIIWSCMATAMACTWASLHLNIPSRDEGSVRIALRRVGVMVLAVVAPEFVIGWAIRQWFVARRIAKDHQRTKTHGFLVLMGGFVQFDGNDGPYTLSPDQVKPLLRQNNITEQDIKDKSKGDLLSKGFALLQTSWFILQCIARGVEHIPITELEIVTLAFATLNFVTYALWWNKPVDVQVPFLVGDRPGERQDPVEDDGGWSKMASIWNRIRKAIKSVPVTIWRGVRHAIDRRLYFVLDVLDFIFYPISVLWEMWLGFDDPIEPQSKRVPTFHAGKLTNNEPLYVGLVAQMFATIFGGIHCLAWSFHFPTHTEQLLWRISSLTITCVPPCVIGTVLLHSFVKKGRVSQYLSDKLLSMIIIISLPALYVLARLSLLVLAFMSLRSLPFEAYRTVHWTTFIPHI